MRHRAATFCFRPEFCTCLDPGLKKKWPASDSQKVNCTVCLQEKKTKILQQLRCKGLCNRISNIWTSFPKKNRKNEDFHNTFAGENRTFGPAGPSSLRTVQTKTVTNGCRKRCCGVFQQGRLGATKVLIIFHKGHVRKEDH